MPRDVISLIRNIITVHIPNADLLTKLEMKSFVCQLLGSTNLAELLYRTATVIRIYFFANL